jgi:hypothetical protein
MEIRSFIVIYNWWVGVDWALPHFDVLGTDYDGNPLLNKRR